MCHHVLLPQQVHHYQAGEAESCPSQKTLGRTQQPGATLMVYVGDSGVVVQPFKDMSPLQKWQEVLEFQMHSPQLQHNHAAHTSLQGPQALCGL